MLVHVAAGGRSPKGNGAICFEPENDAEAKPRVEGTAMRAEPAFVPTDVFEPLLSGFRGREHGEDFAGFETSPLMSARALCASSLSGNPSGR